MQNENDQGMNIKKKEKPFLSSYKYLSLNAFYIYDEWWGKWKSVHGVYVYITKHPLNFV
jgi:hypothetical protein